MERERWLELYHLARKLSVGWPFGNRYNAALIVGVLLWAALHDRPISWACQATHWPAELRMDKLPSQSTMSRRLRGLPVLLLLQLLETALKNGAVKSASSAEPLKIIDAKPLVIGSYAKDPDAHWGRAAGCFAKGYKFYAVWGLGSGARGMADRTDERERGAGRQTAYSETERRGPTAWRCPVRLQSTLRSGA
jgi:hypothetical protein